MRKSLIKIGAIILSLAILCSCSGGGKTSSKRHKLIGDFSPKAYNFISSPLSSDTLSLSSGGLKEISDLLSSQSIEYPYSDLYDLAEVKKRLDFDATVTEHKVSALDDTGKLSGVHLAALVKQNNEAHLSTKPFGLKAVEEDYIAEICEFIVTVTNKMLEKYPDMDKERVYCNLGSLKILYDTGMLSYAEVSSDMVLSISQNNANILSTLEGEDGFTRVMTHEIMHILQIGCACEEIENCGRRAGISVFWEDFTLNTADWTWLVEGSAERNMCSLTGGDAVTYQYKIDYICSMTMSVLLRDEIKADSMETLCFYSDPEALFEVFGCENEEERDELLNMMITLQVLQMQPKSFHAAYTEKTGIDLFEDEEAMNEFSYSLKPAVCLSLSKEFYENLAAFVKENTITANDLFFLINLFEGQLNGHLNYTADSKKEVNKPFTDGYTLIREAFFTTLKRENGGIDLSALYEEYDITAAGKGLYNAELSALSGEKLSFLAERAEYINENGTLGAKVK